jgi:ATP synthase protein I
MFNRDVVRALGMVTQVGISILTPVLLCVFIGVKLNQYFHTQSWFLPMLLLGVGSGIRNVYVLLFANNKKSEQAQGEGNDEEMEETE